MKRHCVAGHVAPALLTATRRRPRAALVWCRWIQRGRLDELDGAPSRKGRNGPRIGDGEYQRVKAYYVLAAVNLHKGLSLNAIGDFGNLRFPGLDRDLHRDWAVEDDRAGGSLDPEPGSKINYTIASLAASF